MPSTNEIPVQPNSTNILEVKTGPGRPVEVRVVPTFRKVLAERVTTGELVPICCAVVHSNLPNPEYQNDLGPFQDAINAAGKLQCRLGQSMTQRGMQRWTEVVVDDDDEVMLDVTQCNHVPTRIYGRQTLPFGVGEVTAYWVAMLESVETIRMDSHHRRMRLLAKYFLYIDEHEGELARIDLSEVREVRGQRSGVKGQGLEVRG